MNNTLYYSYFVQVTTAVATPEEKYMKNKFITVVNIREQ